MFPYDADIAVALASTLGSEEIETGLFLHTRAAIQARAGAAHAGIDFSAAPFWLTSEADPTPRPIFGNLDTNLHEAIGEARDVEKERSWERQMAVYTKNHNAFVDVVLRAANAVLLLNEAVRLNETETRGRRDLASATPRARR